MNKIPEITEEEFQSISDALPGNEKIIQYEVAELYLTRKPKHDLWHRVAIGVICLVMKLPTGYHFFRMYSLKQHKFVYIEHLYLNIQFSASVNFCSFEGKNCMVGLNFHMLANVMNFYKAVEKAVIDDNIIYAMTIEEEEKAYYNHGKTIKKNMRNNRGKSYMNIFDQEGEKTESIPEKKTKPQRQNSKSGKAHSSKSAKSSTKLQISAPYNFVHVEVTDDDRNIAGYYSSEGFKLDECDTDWLLLFVSLGLNSATLANPKIAREIINLVDYYGGIDKVVNIIKKTTYKDQSKHKLTKNKSVESIPDTALYLEKSLSIDEPYKEIKKPKNKAIAKVENSAVPPPPPIPISSTIVPYRSVEPKPAHEPTISEDPKKKEKVSNEPFGRTALLEQIRNANIVLKPIKSNDNNKGEDTSIVGVLQQRLKAMNEMMADSDDENDFKEEDWD